MDRMIVIKKYSNSLEKLKTRINDKIDKVLSFCYDNKTYKALMACVLLIGVALIMFFLNHHTVLASDDYVYSFKFTSDAFSYDTSARLERITSLKDIFESQYTHYFIWGGRSVVHFLAQFFLMYDEWIFDIANTLAYILLLMVIYFHILGRFCWRPGLIILINICLFAFTPATGRDFLWLTGSCNYLWGPLFSFSYLLAFRFQIVQEKPIINNTLLTVFYGMLGIICAWTNENMAVTMVVLALTFNLCTYFYKGYCYRWAVLANIGIVIGTVIMIAAPGNFVRASFYTAYGVSLNLIRNFIDITKMFVDIDFLFIPVCLSLFCYMLNDKVKKDSLLLFYALGLMISMYSLVVSPVIGDSIKVTSLIFAIIVLGRCYDAMQITSLNERKVWVISIVLMIVFSGKIYKTAFKDIIVFEEREIANIKFVLQAKETGNMNPVITGNSMTTKYGAEPAGEVIIKTNPRHWRNNSFANYYGLNTVRTKSE